MKLYGLIGNPLSHSFSRTYFTKKFTDENILDCSYENFELQNIHEFPLLIKQYPNLCGVNVTRPYKEEVLSFIDFRNEVVEQISACNCIKIDHKKLSGFNTDVVGFEKSFRQNLMPHHTKALILGSGGAAKAVQYVLKKLNITCLIVSRSSSNFSITYADLDKSIIKQYTVIINATPSGMYPNINEAPPMPYQFLNDRHLLFDLTYNPPKTLFLQKGEKQGASICNGYEMLVQQAEASWNIWNG
ncbi:MAG: shikimate dehydrogenase [Chitinophagaceae bacterium]